MKTKVILFSILLICSKFVDSIPHSEDLVSQRAYPLFEWQVNQNAQNEEYLDTDITQNRNKNTLRNSAIQQENTQKIYENQKKHNYDSYGNVENPASSPSEKELLVNFDSTTDEHRFDSYSPRLESYPSRTFQVGSDNQQYKNQNKRSQNQYANSALSTVLIPDIERPLLNVHEPYRGPVQYLQPKYIPSSNRQYYQADRLAWLPTKEKYQYPEIYNIGEISGDNKHIVNSPHRFVSSGPVPYDNYREEQAALSLTKARPTRRNVQSFAPQSGIIYKDAPAVIATDNFPGQFENIKYNFGDNKYVANSPPRFESSGPVRYDNYDEEQVTPSEIKARPTGSRRNVQNVEPRSETIFNEASAVAATDTLADLSDNIKYIGNYRSRSHRTKYDDGSPVISSPVNTKTVAPADISKDLSEKPLVRRYAKNYRSDWINDARDDSYNVAPTAITENVEVKSGKYEPNYGSDNGPKEYVRGPARTDTVLVNSKNNKYEDSNEPQNGLNSSTPLNNNPSQDVYHLSSGIKEYNLQSNKNILAATKKRFVVVVPPNGTVEYVDRHNLDSQQNSKIRLVAGDRVLAAPSPADRSNVKPLPVYTKQLADDNMSKSLLSSLNEPAEDENSKPLPQDVNQPVNDANSKPLPQHLRQLEHVEKLKPKHSHVNEPEGDNNSKLLPTYTNPPEDDKDLKSLPSYKKQPAHQNKSKPVSSYGNQPGDDDSLEPLPLYTNQPDDDKNCEPLPPYVNKLHNKPKPSHDATEDDTNSKPLHQYVRQLANDKKSKPLPPDENQSEDDNNPKLLISHENEQENENKSKNPHQSADNDYPKPLPLYVSQSTHEKKSKNSHVILPKHEVNLELSSSYENLKSDDKNPEPLPLYVSQPANDKASKPLPSNENQSEDDNNSKTLRTFENQSAHDKNKFTSEHSHESQRADDDNSETLDANQPEDDKKSKSEHVHKSQPAGDDNSKPLPLYVNQPTHQYKSKYLHIHPPVDDDNSKPFPQYVSQIANDEKSKPLLSDENQPEDDNDSEPLPPYTNEPTYYNIPKPKDSHDVTADDVNSKPLPLYVSQLANDETSKPLHSDENQPENDNHSKPLQTTSYPDDTAETQIITLSPIEQAIDNVSDVPPETTTTTTRPVKIPDKVDTIKDASNKQDDAQANSSSEDIASILDKVQTYSVPTISQSNPASLTDNISDEKTVIEAVILGNQTNDKTDVNQVINGKKGIQTAMYNSSELLDTNTDVLAESDDHSSVTTSTSVQNDVNAVSTSGDIALEPEQSETDVIITNSSNTANDTEDDIVTINIEILESTDDADSDEKTPAVSIDTENDSDDNSKTSKAEEKQHNNNDGRGKNVEIDLANLKDPVMWVRTTDQDLIDKLIDNNEKKLDVIYFFEINNEPIIEREKETTKFCNGTVLIETKEITYAHKDDPTPTIVITTEIIQIEDDEP